MMKNNMPTSATRFQLEAHRPPHQPHPIHQHGMLPPPHMHHARMRMNFEEQAWNRILSPWTDEDSKAAVGSCIHAAPPEMQILADQCQLLMAHFEAAGMMMSCDTQGASDNIATERVHGHINNYGWSNPVLTSEIRRMYDKLYGEDGKAYLEVLETSPFEVAAVSTLLAFLMTYMEVK